MLIKLGEFKGMKEHFEFSEFDKHADSENEYSEFDELSLHKSIELFANNHIYIDPGSVNVSVDVLHPILAIFWILQSALFALQLLCLSSCPGYQICPWPVYS
jgi:hypothetical protein